MNLWVPPVVRELHHGDLLQILSDSGLGVSDDATEWINARSICNEGLGQFIDEMLVLVGPTDASEEHLVGMFVSGFTLGLAVGELRQRESVQSMLEHGG